MRQAIFLAAALTFGAGAAQAQLLDGRFAGGIDTRDYGPGASVAPDLTARAAGGVVVNPGGYITPRIGSRQWDELEADAHARAAYDARAYGSAYSAPYAYDSRYDTRAHSHGQAGYNGYAYGQQDYAAGSYVWVGNQGWVWVPQGATVHANGAVTGGFRASDARGYRAGRAGAVR